jgi:hypothetical protein
MEDDESRVAGWTIFGVLCGFKLLTAVMILIMAPSVGSAIFLLIFHWFWIVPLLVVGGVTGIAWMRLVRARAKRERLRRAEFMVDYD